MAAIWQPRPPSLLNRHAGNATQRYPREVSPHPPQSPSLPAGERALTALAALSGGQSHVQDS